MPRRARTCPLWVTSRHRVRPRYVRYSPQSGHSTARFARPLSAKKKGDTSPHVRIENAQPMVLLGLGPWEKVTEAAQAKRVANSFRPLVQWRRRTVVEAAPEPTDREASMPEPDPSHIMQVGMGFFASKTLLSAVELGLFTELAKQPMTGAEIVRSLGLNHRAVPDFPDSLVALKFLERAGDGPDARYFNTPDSAMFLDRQSRRLYRWHPGDGQRSPVPLLGRPYRGAQDRYAAKRDQELRRADVRQALRDARTSRAVHERDVRGLGWKLQDVFQKI